MFSGKKKVICQICSKENHVATKCFKRSDPNFQGLENTQSSGGSQASQFQAHLTQSTPSPSTVNSYPFYQSSMLSNGISSTSSQRSGNEWYVDSGATHHVTSSLDQMHIQTPYTCTSNLIVGNDNRVSIKHVGSMKVPSL
ncbi:hypothetical protein ACS0TY_018378 [Phlomoides rotata]